MRGLRILGIRGDTMRFCCRLAYRMFREKRPPVSCEMDMGTGKIEVVRVLLSELNKLSCKA